MLEIVAQVSTKFQVTAIFSPWLQQIQEDLQDLLPQDIPKNPVKCFSIYVVMYVWEWEW